MKDIHRIALLFDFYGTLLTERQQELVRDYYLNDLSLGEIAPELGVTRQAVHDLLRRAEAALEGYEARMGLLATHEAQRLHLSRLLDLLQQAAGQVPGDAAAATPLRQAVALAARLLDGQDVPI